MGNELGNVHTCDDWKSFFIVVKRIVRSWPLDGGKDEADVADVADAAADAAGTAGAAGADTAADAAGADTAADAAGAAGATGAADEADITDVSNEGTGFITGTGFIIDSIRITRPLNM